MKAKAGHRNSRYPATVLYSFVLPRRSGHDPGMAAEGQHNPCGDGGAVDVPCYAGGAEKGLFFRMRTAQPGTRQNRNLIRKTDRRDRDESLINQDLNVLSDAFRIRASSSFTISLS